MGPGMRTSRAPLASAITVVLAMLSACSPTAEPDAAPTTPGSVAHVAAPNRDQATDPAPGPSLATTQEAQHDGHADDGHDLHDHLAEDLDAAPDVAELPAIYAVAGDFWVAMKELRWDHPRGATQWLEQVEPYTTDRFQGELGDLYAGSTGGVTWTGWVMDEKVTVAEVREVSFRPELPFTADRVQVQVEGATVDHSPRQSRIVDSVRSVFTVVELVRTEAGWLVDGLPDG